MAFTSGTATDYLDLLNRLKQFVTQDMLPAGDRWSVLRWVPGPPAELVLRGPGLAGTYQINVGVLSETGADYAIALRSGPSAGLLPLPGQGPLLVGRALARGLPPGREWALTMADIELF